MSRVWLSIVLPSVNIDGRRKLFDSLMDTTSEFKDIQIALNDKEYDDPYAGRFFEDAYRLATGEWLFFANDDCTMETIKWDQILRSRLLDKFTLYWPDDTIFQDRLSCFPIVSKTMMDLAEDVWPMPYKRYKVDDTLMAIAPKLQYLPEIIFKHHNDKGTFGYTLPDGRCYPNDLPILSADTDLFNHRRELHQQIRTRLCLRTH